MKVNYNKYFCYCYNINRALYNGLDIFCPFEINIGYELPRLQSLSFRLYDDIDDTGNSFFRSHICEIYLSRRYAKQSLDLVGCLGDFCEDLPAMSEGGLITQVSELMLNCQVDFQLPIHCTRFYLGEWELNEAQTVSLASLHLQKCLSADTILDGRIHLQRYHHRDTYLERRAV